MKRQIGNSNVYRLTTATKVLNNSEIVNVDEIRDLSELINKKLYLKQMLDNEFNNQNNNKQKLLKKTCETKSVLFY